MSDQITSPLKYFISGGFGGICTILTGHPLDTIKVRLQTMPASVAGQPYNPLYLGTWDCAKKTVQREGFTGLYKGMGAPLVGVAPMFAISFLGFAFGKRLQQTADNPKLSYMQMYLAGSFSGIWTTIVATPGERIKCILQVQQGTPGVEQKYKGPVDVFKKLYKEGGIRTLFKGTCATLLRDVPASGMYYYTYEVIQDMARKYKGSDKLSLSATIFAGGCAGVTYWILGMPADVLKSRLQTAPSGSYPNGIRDVFKDLMAKEGPLALYKGVTPVMIRAFPANAACFFGFELCMQFLNKFSWIA